VAEVALAAAARLLSSSAASSGTVLALSGLAAPVVDGDDTGLRVKLTSWSGGNVAGVLFNGGGEASAPVEALPFAALVSADFFQIMAYSPFKTAVFTRQTE
jgi:hypothetical protein